jgi:hypothetical protein
MRIPCERKKPPRPTLALLLLCVCAPVKWTVLQGYGDAVAVSALFPATRDIRCPGSTLLNKKTNQDIHHNL